MFILVIFTVVDKALHFLLSFPSTCVNFTNVKLVEIKTGPYQHGFQHKCRLVAINIFSQNDKLHYTSYVCAADAGMFISMSVHIDQGHLFWERCNH